MNINIIVLGTGDKADALIKEAKISDMPSVQENWKFDFKKQMKNLKNATGYILVKEDTPQMIEGCMIFQLINKREPYLAFVEVAPHNKGEEKKHDHVAGSLMVMFLNSV